MSWKIINRIIGLATINPTFRQRLQQEPEVALKEEGFELTPQEMEAFKTFAPLPFTQFCQQLLKSFAADGSEE